MEIKSLPWLATKSRLFAPSVAIADGVDNGGWLGGAVTIEHFVEDGHGTIKLPSELKV
jgi:hypothetical protein